MATEAINTTLLGSAAPDFSLPDVVTRNPVTLSDLPPVKALLIMFICRHCPYVVHVKSEILRLARAPQRQHPRMRIDGPASDRILAPVGSATRSPRRIVFECVALAVHSWVTTPSRT